MGSLQNGKASHESDTPTSETQCKLLRTYGQQRYTHEEAQGEEYYREEEADAEYLKALLVVHTHDFLGELGFEGGSHGGEGEVGWEEEGLGFNVLVVGGGVELGIGG